MWARHRPDITLRDLGFALRQVVRTKADDAGLDAEVVRGWIPEREAVVCLSVRSGFDLLLQAIPLGAGDHVLFTEVTISGMIRVAEHAGCVVSGVPIDRATLAPTADAVASRITPRTRAIVVAPLFGARNSIAAIAETARSHGVLVIEDAAQAFAGTAYGGSDDADVTMFSFGMIKRATAGGGGVLRVRDPALHAAMRDRQRGYPTQSRRDYARRLAMLALLRTASDRRLYGPLYRLLAATGDPDRFVSNLGKTGRSSQTLQRLRRRPCGPMKRLMARRIRQHAVLPSMVSGEALAALGATACGYGATTPPRWVLPVAVADPERAAHELRQAGFDASALSSLIRVAADDAGAKTHWLADTLFLPTDDAMPEATRARMLRAAKAL